MQHITVMLDGSGADRAQLDAALAVARPQDAHIAAVHCRADSRDSIPWIGEGMSGPLIQQMIDAAEREAGQRAAVATKAFEDWIAAAGLGRADDPAVARGLGAALRVVTGRPEEAVVRLGRLSDLVVLPGLAEGAGPVREVVFENAVFSTGRPALLVPVGASEIGRTIAILWNGSAQAARAVASAMPLLRRAARVHVLTAVESADQQHLAAELPRYLAWHGIQATAHTVATDAADPPEALRAEAAGFGADLIVMGAYTHSRFREIVLGGVTRQLIRTTTVPLFLVH